MGFVTLAHADRTEAAVAAPVHDDPALALAAADRDGLLTYVGYRSGDRYDVLLFGQKMPLEAGDVVPLVRRLRAVIALRDVGVELLGLTAGRQFAVTVNGVPEVIEEEKAIDWAAGYRAAFEGGPSPSHVGVDNLGQIIDLFERPTFNDQMRMILLGLMYGRPGMPNISADQLKLMVGRSKKTTVDGLRFGRRLAPKLAELMIAAFGMRWSLATGGVEMADGSAPPDPIPQMPGLVRLKAIIAASRAGWLRYVDKPRPNDARWLTRYQLAIGKRVHVVKDVELPSWLHGVASYHRSQGDETAPPVGVAS